MCENEFDGACIDFVADDLIAPDNITTEAQMMIDGALEWHRDYYEQYDPFRWQDKQKRRVRRKAFNEVSVFVEFMSRFSGYQDQITPLTEHVIETVNDRRYYNLLARDPAEILKLGFPILVPATRDVLTPEAESTVEYVLDHESAWAPERQPFAQLQFYQLLQLLGRDTRHLDPDSIITGGIATTPPNIIQIKRTNVYELTHDIFAYTNLGLPTEGFSESISTDLSTVLAGLLLRYIAEEDPDAVAELILAGTIQRQVSPELIRVAFSWLCSIATDRNTIPGSGVRDATATADQEFDSPAIDVTRLGNWNEASKQWFYDYHTVIVSCEAFTLLERDWEVLQANAPDRDIDLNDPAVIKQLLSLGKLIELLSEYKLKDAAPLIESLVDTPVVHAYDDVFTACVTFIRNQRTQDGHIGFYTDEKKLYSGMGKNPEQFETELRDPCTDRCEKALETVDRWRDN